MSTRGTSPGASTALGGRLTGSPMTADGTTDTVVVESAESTGGGSAGLATGPKLMVSSGERVGVTATSPTTITPAASALSTEGRKRRGRTRSRMGFSSNQAETAARTRVRATRMANSGHGARWVRAGVSHRKIGQWKRYAP